MKTLELANELQVDFKKNHKVLCCSILTKGMDMASGEHKAQCVAFTGEVAANTARLIVRELDFVNTDEDAANQKGVQAMKTLLQQLPLPISGLMLELYVLVRYALFLTPVPATSEANPKRVSS